MEEDIKILEDKTNALGLFLKCKGTEKYKQAIENLIKGYRELETNNYEQNNIINEYIEENKCLHCGKNVAGYCEECYQDLIGANAKLQFENKNIENKYKDILEGFNISMKELKKYKENALFICDPDKNKECKKTNCYKNGGECMQTNNINYRKENKIKIKAYKELLDIN